MSSPDEKAPPSLEEDGFVDISPNADGGLFKKIIVEGSGTEQPPSGSDVTVHYVGTLHADGSKFDSSRDRPGHFNFEVGVGQVIKAWDIGICTMKKGEKAILRARADYAYGEHGSPPKIPGGAALNFEVELFSWKEKMKEPSDMSAEERSQYALAQKERGNSAFAAKDFAAAVEEYDEGQRYITHGQGAPAVGDGHGHSHGHGACNHDHGGGDEQEPELNTEDKKLAVALLSNLAMARLKLDEPDMAKFDCTKALEIDAENTKVLYRRATANLAMGDYEAATADAVRILEIDETHKEAAQFKQRVELEIKKAAKKEKDMFSKMFK